MKICFLAGADSIHSYRWVKFFADQGHAVDWISLAALEFPPVQGISFHRIRPRGNGALTFLGAVLEVRRLVKQIAPDILHAHYVGGYGLMGALTRLHPFVATAWGSDVLFAGKSRIRGPFVKHVLRSADLITCDADHMITAMEALGADRAKMRIIYFGIDTARFRPAPQDADLRKRLGGGDGPLVISLRNFHPVYDLETLIKAVPEVLRRVPNAVFVIVGTGPQEGMLKDLAASLGVSQQVRFLGRVENAQLPTYLSSMDVYVSTSLSDAGIAASTAEAMACGLPVVITDSGENQKWLEDGEGGYIVPTRDPEALADKVAFLLENPEIRPRCGEVNRRTIEVRNDYYREMARMEGLYRQLTSGPTLAGAPQRVRQES